MPLAQRYHAYAIDTLGHGFTDKPDVAYRIPDFAQHVLDFADAIGAARVHLVGHGLAGWVATYLAVHHPQRVRSLVNFNGLTHLKAPDEHTEAGAQQIVRLSTAATVAPSREAVRKRLEFALADPATLTEEMLEVRFAIYSQPDVAQAMAKIVQIESAAQRAYGLTAEQLGTLRLPVQLIFAPNPVETLENFERMRDAIRGAKLATLEHGGLIGMWESPEEFNRIVLAFLDDVTQTERE
jgi:2-hydroxy-6-oxo-6-(2'-carboxyphenyl)-hexa-2,4-dienoate hydrolase